MGTVELIKDGFRKIFEGADVLRNHVFLFALSGLLALQSEFFHNFSEQAKLGNYIAGPGEVTIRLILMLVVSLYLGGYSFMLMNKCFSNNGEGILPEIGLNQFKAALKAIPLQIVWGLYLFAAILISVFLMTSIGPVPGSIFFIAIVFTAMFIQFIFAAFSKDFCAKGLFNITLPAKYMQKTFGDMIVLIILFVVLAVLVLIPFVIVAIITALTKTDGTVTEYLFSLAGGYVGILLQLVWYYCIVNIYKDKLENAE